MMLPSSSKATLENLCQRVNQLEHNKSTLEQQKLLDSINSATKLVQNLSQIMTPMIPVIDLTAEPVVIKTEKEDASKDPNDVNVASSSEDQSKPQGQPPAQPQGERQVHSPKNGKCPPKKPKGKKRPSKQKNQHNARNANNGPRHHNNHRRGDGRHSDRYHNNRVEHFVLPDEQCVTMRRSHNDHYNSHSSFNGMQPPLRGRGYSRGGRGGRMRGRSPYRGNFNGNRGFGRHHFLNNRFNY